MKHIILFFIFFFFVLTQVHSQLSPCNCWLTRDSSWSVAHFDGSGASGGPGLPPDYRNDDWCTDSIVLPFTYCFFGDSVHSIYINNNCNVSIDTSYGPFESYPFPFYLTKIIAPFMADVDTRGPLSGIVYYKVDSNFIAVQWDGVGYYGVHDDKLNQVQLVLSDGSPSRLPVGMNTGFCYKSMEWTTGDASQGTNGFGGVPADVGIDYGDNINFLQLGLYDNSSSGNDGPFGNNDGIFSLANQSYAFNTCVSNFNIPPVLNAQFFCDTIQVCLNDTFTYKGNFIATNDSEIVTVTVLDYDQLGVNLTSTPGTVADFTLSFIANYAGGYFVDLFAYDDATPHTYITYSLIFNIQNCNVGIDEINDQSIIAPNPFSNELKYSFSEKQDISITDPTGKIMFFRNNEMEGFINTTEWKSGIYFMMLASDKSRRTIKLIKN